MGAAAGRLPLRQAAPQAFHEVDNLSRSRLDFRLELVPGAYVRGRAFSNFARV